MKTGLRRRIQMVIGPPKPIHLSRPSATHYCRWGRTTESWNADTSRQEASKSWRTMHGSKPACNAVTTAGIRESSFCVPWATVWGRVFRATWWTSLTPTTTTTTFQPPAVTVTVGPQQPYSRPTSVKSAWLRSAMHAMHRSLAAINVSVRRVRHGWKRKLMAALLSHSYHHGAALYYTLLPRTVPVTLANILTTLLTYVTYNIFAGFFSSIVDVSVNFYATFHF